MRVRPDLLKSCYRDEHNGSGTGAGSQAEGASPELKLDYIAAMLRQLRRMSPAGECPVLAGLLDLAHREAVLRRRSGQA